MHRFEVYRLNGKKGTHKVDRKALLGFRLLTRFNRNLTHNRWLLSLPLYVKTLWSSGNPATIGCLRVTKKLVWRHLSPLNWSNHCCLCYFRLAGLLITKRKDSAKLVENRKTMILMTYKHIRMRLGRSLNACSMDKDRY